MAIGYDLCIYPNFILFQPFQNKSLIVPSPTQNEEEEGLFMEGLGMCAQNMEHGRGSSLHYHNTMFYFHTLCEVNISWQMLHSFVSHGLLLPSRTVPFAKSQKRNNVCLST